MKRLATLLATAAFLLAAVPSTFAADKPTKTIVEIATANGSFTTLLAAVGCADASVGAALTGKGPLTVFAPTDAAFAKAGLTKDNICTAVPKAALTKILLYHVASGTLLSSQVLPAKWDRVNTVRTLRGQPIWALHNGTLFTSSGGVARILVKQQLFDIMATNGVIHVVDRVLMPRG